MAAAISPSETVFPEISSNLSSTLRKRARVNSSPAAVFRFWAQATSITGTVPTPYFQLGPKHLRESQQRGTIRALRPASCPRSPISSTVCRRLQVKAGKYRPEREVCISAPQRPKGSIPEAYTSSSGQK